MSEVTAVLQAAAQGDPQAADKLLPLLYHELRKLAAARLAQEKPGQTLQATALVHEAYLRLVTASGGREPPGDSPPHWNSRAHFFAAAARAMRQILVDNARRKRSPKHGGDLHRHDLGAIEIAADEMPEDVVALDEALTRLAISDKKAAELVHLRFFAGLPLAEAAELLGISPRSADRLWAYARAWLYQELRGAGIPPADANPKP